MTDLGPNGRHGAKAGISWPIQEGTNEPVIKYFERDSKLSWFYNWNKNWDVIVPTPTGQEIPAEFVPMIFAPSYLNNEFQVQEGWKILLGFNEPDHTDASVAVNQSAEQAAEAWVELAKLRTSPDLKLASPAVAGNIDWLKQFFLLIPKETKPDYLAVHIYTTTFEDFVRRIEVYWETFGLPIILTEFAMQSFDPNVPPPTNQQQVHDFMGRTTQWLDKTDYIVYAWFGTVRDAANLHGVHPFNRLMDEKGDFTPLGRQYFHGGHAD